jgi:hypothetical protein
MTTTERRMTDTQDATLQAQIGPYSSLKAIGKGTFGVVWLEIEITSTPSSKRSYVLTVLVHLGRRKETATFRFAAAWGARL